MGEGVEKQVGDVLIGQTIEDVFAVSAAGDEAFIAQNAEALGDGGEVFVFGGGDFGDAGFTLAQ